MTAIWFIDRGSALVAYATLWFAMLTGILYNARPLGWAQRVAKPIHVPASVIASASLLIHVGAGFVDVYEVLAAKVPPPAYSNAYFVVGVLVGLSALVILVTSILAFVDPKRFQRPWDPKVVHALAYGGFVFATIHAVAIGTDFATFLKAAGAAASALLLYVLVMRVLADVAGRRKQPAP